VTALRYGFQQCGFEEILGFASAPNVASRRMMGRLQMTLDPDGDFEYPGLSGEHRLLQHKLYRARRDTWRARRDTWPGRALTSSEWNQKVIEEFRANGGRLGDTFEGHRLLVLTSTGARSGEPRTNPTMYLPDADRYVIFATSGGRPRNPAWYYNLRANPRARIEVGSATLDVVAEEMTGTERDRLYAAQVTADPSFAAYKKQSARRIPVVALTPAERSRTRTTPHRPDGGSPPAGPAEQGGP
jgi:deazaflavin-dependent oxidoreductase (nitroreductase family)